MKQNSSIQLLSVLLLSMLIAGANSLGGWKPITDTKSQQVVEIGKYAVNEYNQRAETSLEFESVVSGEVHVVAGAMYKLVLTAKDGSEVSNNYEAIVWDKLWAGFRNLTSFKPV